MFSIFFPLKMRGLPIKNKNISHTIPKTAMANKPKLLQDSPKLRVCKLPPISFQSVKTTFS
jgi:hypothetical protein